MDYQSDIEKVVENNTKARAYLAHAIKKAGINGVLSIISNEINNDLARAKEKNDSDLRDAAELFLIIILKNVHRLKKSDQKLVKDMLEFEHVKNSIKFIGFDSDCASPYMKDCHKIMEKIRDGEKM